MKRELVTTLLTLSLLASSLPANALAAEHAAPVLQLSLTSPKWVRAYVTEPQLGRIRYGMKADILTDDEVKAAEDYVRSKLPKAVVLKASGLKDEGVDEILIELFKVAPYGDMLYPEESYTDQNLEFRISEIIREKTINLLSDELPHVIYVEVADIEYDEEDSSVWVRAFIVTEREGQKGIIVGKGGENIKRIRKESFKEIRRIFPGSKLNLDLRVKAQNKWRNNQATLDRLFRQNT